jgi:hypothetical protein
MSGLSHGRDVIGAKIVHFHHTEPPQESTVLADIHIRWILSEMLVPGVSFSVGHTSHLFNLVHNFSLV